MTLRSSMAAIAVLAVTLAAARANLYLGILAGCIACGTFARSAGAISRRRRAGLSVTPGQRARVVLSSLAVSTIILIVPDLVFLSIVGPYGSFLYKSKFLGSVELLCLALIAAMLVARGLTARLWRCEIGSAVRREDRDKPPRLDAAAVIEAAVGRGDLVDRPDAP